MKRFNNINLYFQQQIDKIFCFYILLKKIYFFAIRSKNLCFMHYLKAQNNFFHVIDYIELIYNEKYN